jgi:hypothetical protein
MKIIEVVFVAKIITDNNNTLVYARHCKLSIDKDGSAEIVEDGLFKNIHLSIMNDDEYLKFINSIKCKLLFLDSMRKEHVLVTDYNNFLARTKLLSNCIN